MIVFLLRVLSFTHVVGTKRIGKKKKQKKKITIHVGFSKRYFYCARGAAQGGPRGTYALQTFRPLYIPDARTQLLHFN